MASQDAIRVALELGLLGLGRDSRSLVPLRSAGGEKVSKIDFEKITDREREALRYWMSIGLSLKDALQCVYGDKVPVRADG